MFTACCHVDNISNNIPGRPNSTTPPRFTARSRSLIKSSLKLSYR